MKFTALSTTARRRRLLPFAAVGLLAFCQIFLFTNKALAAACAAPATDYGTATGSVSIPAAATYRVWTRLKIPDTTNNNYLLELDGNKCYTVGGGGVTANTWTWVSWQNGNVSSKIDVALTQASHAYKLIGNKPGVMVDRLVFTSDLTCTPTSASGTECNTPTDGTAPTVVVTAPAASAKVTGSVTFSATATDNTAVSKVEFYVNSTLLATDTTAPYSTSWDSSKVPNGAQLLTARAYDAANNVSNDSLTVTSANGDTKSPTAPTNLQATAPAYNSVTLMWTASTDETGVTGYSITRDGVPLANTGNVTTYSDKNLTAGTTYSYKILAFDAAGNKSAYSNTVSVTTPKVVGDTQPPTAPTNLAVQAISSSQLTLTWVASTDNTGVTGYNVYRGQGSTTPALIATSPTPSFGDTNLTAGTAYTYYVIAKDSSGNLSPASSTVTASTEVPIQPSHNFVIRGLITDQASGKRLTTASVVVTIGNSRHIYQANSSGAYAIQELVAGHYNLTFRAKGYLSKTVSVTITDQPITEKNVTLQKR